MNPDCDIVVVGGGPCGSFAALTAAKLGAHVTLFEEHKEIGVPAHCAGHISLRGLRQLGLGLPRNVFENQFTGAVFYSPSGHEFRVRFDSAVTCALDRHLLDKHLSGLAEEAGVKFHLGTRVDSLTWEKGFVTGVAVKGNSVRSRIVIDSEGCSSGLLKKSGLPTLNRLWVVNGVEAEVNQIEDVDQGMVEVYLGRKYAPGFYAWIIPRRDGSAKVGLATRAGDPRKNLEHFVRHNPKASEKIGHSKLVRISYHPITLGGPIVKTCYNGLMVVGDAASQVKPTTGGGVVMGLNCARIAGETAHQAVNDEDCSEDFLSSYQRRWRRAIGFDMTVMRQIRLRVNCLSDEKLNRLIGLCSDLHVEDALRRVKDIDFQGRSLISLIRSPGALMAASYFFLASVTQ